jgi:hypothetical protein
VLRDPARGRQLEDEDAVHLLVEVEVEGIEPLADVAKAGELHPAFEKPILPAEQFVLHEPGEEIDGGEFLGLRFEQAGLEPGGDAGAAELAQGTLQFDDVHGRTSSVFRATTSR